MTRLLRACGGVTVTRRLVWTALVGLCGLPAVATAQDRPFVFSLTTTSTASTPQVRVDYEVGAGDQVFHQQTANGLEQRLGVQVSVGRLTLVGHVGLAAETRAFQMSQQGEMLFSLFKPGASRTALAVGGGVLHEAGGATVLLARVVAGHEWTRTRLLGNMLVQKPLASGRDNLDIITSAGWAVRVTPAWALGVEAIGEDLEGFWDPLEAEGGSRILVGPSLHVAPPHKRWQLSVAGGPTFHPTTSGRSSDALRALPATTGRHDYAVRTTFAYRF
jgi:hypothetical protein